MRLVLEWTGELGARTRAALVEFDLRCKTLDPVPGRWALRTKRWNRTGNRARGLWYAGGLAAVLRAAGREGTALIVRGRD